VILDIKSLNENSKYYYLTVFTGSLHAKMQRGKLERGKERERKYLSSLRKNCWPHAWNPHQPRDKQKKGARWRYMKALGDGSYGIVWQAEDMWAREDGEGLIEKGFNPERVLVAYTVISH
jgi:hypothetical protein